MSAEMADLRNDVRAADRRVHGVDRPVSRLEETFGIAGRHIFGRNETAPEPTA